jgi:hypothetical protein
MDVEEWALAREKSGIGALADHGILATGEQHRLRFVTHPERGRVGRGPRHRRDSSFQPECSPSDGPAAAAFTVAGLMLNLTPRSPM